MISCPKCGKENQDHYKFCLGCGNELPRDGSGGQRPFRPTPPAAIPAVGADRRPASPGPAANPAPAVIPNPLRGPTPAPVPQPLPGVQPAPFSAPLPEPSASPFGGPQPLPASPQVVAPAQPSPGFSPLAPTGPAALPAAPPPGLGAAALAPTPIAAQPVVVPPSAPAERSFPSTCPQCLSPNPRNNRFCITCGFDMANAPPAPAPPPPVPPPAPVAPIQQAPVQVVAPAPPQQPQQAFAAPVERARLVLIRPDGTEGGSFTLHDGETRVGRDTGGVFSQDLYLSPLHATFNISASSVTVRDENSLNGVYLRIERQQPVELRDGDLFRIGQEILRYESFRAVTPESDGTEWMGSQIEGLVGKISLVIGRDSFGNAFPIPITGLYLGRERGDILFPEDGYVSGLHCQLSVTGGRLMLVDVNSSNGTYLRIRTTRSLKNGDFLLMGQQLFRLTLI